MKINAKIGVIVLAAGSSSRLGYPKQLVEFRGNSLLQHSIDLTGSLKFSTKILVLGAREGEIRNKIDSRDFQVVINENWMEGMGTSISKGVTQALKIENELDHILIMLSDQPFVTEEKIKELVQVQLKGNSSATFSEYAGDVGVPAIFSRDLFPDLQKLKNDQGAKKLLFVKKFSYRTVKLENGNFDVDTAEDVELLKQMEKNRQ